MRSAKKFQGIINQVPADYYYRGIKNNLLQKYWHSKKWSIIVKLLSDNTKGELLDVGCADGTTTHQIHKNFPKLKITGIDYYPKAINFARKTKPKIKFVIGDAHKLPFGDKSFDYAVAIETIEHLQNPRKAIAEIYRVLKPRGYLIIGQDTDSLLFRIVWWLWTKWKGSVWNHSHINCMKPKELMKLVRRSGFKIEDLQYVNLGMEVFLKAKKFT